MQLDRYTELQGLNLWYKNMINKPLHTLKIKYKVRLMYILKKVLILINLTKTLKTSHLQKIQKVKDLMLNT